MTQTHDWMVGFVAEQAARKTAAAALFARNKAAIIPALANLGIAMIELAYDGMGDSGCVEQPDYFGPDGEALAAPKLAVDIEEFTGGVCEVARVSRPLGEALTELAYQALESHHPGWEINDGACGTLRIDVAENRMVLCCSLRTTEYFEDEIGGAA